MKKISIVVPVFNEEENLHEFHKRLLLLEFLKLMGVHGVLMHFLTGKTVRFCGKTWDF